MDSTATQTPQRARSQGAPHIPARALRRHTRRFASLRTITALVLREMSTTNGRSPGGYLWAILEPVAGIALLTLVFSVAFRNPALGINFPLFYSTGMIPFVMFTDISGKVAQALNFSRPLLAYPSVTFMDAIIARFLVNLLTELMVAYIVFAGILLFFETRVILDLPLIALGLGLAAALGLGVGTLNCFLFIRFPIWQQVWSILMRPLVILSCTFLLYGQIPQPFRGYLWFNPIVHVVGLTRAGFYANYDASYTSPLYVLGFAGICMVMGLVLLRRYHQDMMER